jgi:ER degradation enhancer, mannosidase alpha-like 2
MYGPDPRLWLVSLISLLLACAPSPAPVPKPQPPVVPSPTARATDTRAQQALAERVREAFLHGWRAYVDHAWGHDELEPLSKTAHDWHAHSLLITPVDALDMLIMLGLHEEADRTRAYIDQHLSFDHDISVKNFEITIRVLGGLLSAHQMTGDARLLERADDLGRRLLPAFESRTGMPYMFVNLATGKTREPVSNPAEIGTLLLEFGTLAKLTGKGVYYDKAKRALVELFARRSPIGLVGHKINVETGEWVGQSSHVGGGIDSYYEYLLKAWLLFGDEDCRKMWSASRDAMNRWVADDVGGELWYGRVDMTTGARTRTTFGALEAFLPGVLVLDGDLDRARRLQDSAFSMWTTAGIEPESFDYRARSVVHPGYPLRPEIIESTYYLWNATADARYIAMGKRMFEDIVVHAHHEVGYTSLKDVTKRPMERGNLMPSFFLAETLKYFHLLFSPPGTVDPKRVVFTTEAHPLRRTW